MTIDHTQDRFIIKHIERPHPEQKAAQETQPRMIVERVNLSPELVHELQPLERVAISEEQEMPTGRSMPRFIAIRQADYLTRHILNGRLSDWWSAIRSEARPSLVVLKIEADDSHGADVLADLFADRVIDTLARAQHIRVGLKAG